MFMNQRPERSGGALAVFALCICGGCLAGCGGGAEKASGRAPILTAPTDRSGFGVTPSPLVAAGGLMTVTVVARIVPDPKDATYSVNPDSVKIEVIDDKGSSLLGGPKVMLPLNSLYNGYDYEIALPKNAGNKSRTYTARVIASDSRGNVTSPPFIAGSATVPGM